MKSRHTILLLFLTAILCACHTQKALNEGKHSSTQQPDTTLLPAFSGELLYLFGREYEAMHDSLSPKFNTPEARSVRRREMSMADYVEQRLIEFFPKVAYQGMVRKWQLIAEHIASQDETGTILFNNQELNLQPIQQTVPAFGKDDNEESRKLMLNEEEAAFFNRLNALANSSRQARAKDLPKAHYSLTPTEPYELGIHDSFTEENILVSLLLAGGPYACYRVLLAKQRAESKAKEFYGADAGAGKRGDAFKHLYVNVLLTSYLNEYLANFVMDTWEEINPNQPCDRYMDLHNNYIGRHERYHAFHGDSEDRHVWAENVHRFVEDTTANAVCMPWTKETTLFQVNQDLRKVPKDKYVYWNSEVTQTEEQ